MNPAIKLVATLIVAAILCTLAVLVGMIILGVTPSHAQTLTSSVVVARGGHHK